MAVDDGGANARQTPLLSLIRHPETTANVGHVLQGATDSPLTVNGRQQADRLADAVGEAVRATVGKTKAFECDPVVWDVQGGVVRARTVQHSPLVRPGRPPTHILSSPSGRAHTLALAIRSAILTRVADAQSSCPRSEDDRAKEEAADEKVAGYEVPDLIVRSGLAERSFGKREGQAYSRGALTIKGKYVDPLELVALRSESRDAFHQRVSNEAEHLLSLLSGRNPIEPSGVALHIVVVTHGLWIRTFLDVALGRIYQPFTQNTGIFTLGLLDSFTRNLANPPDDRIRYGLVCQNDTSHLTGLKRQRGGIGSSASDKRQQTLKQVWQAPQGSLQNGHALTASCSRSTKAAPLEQTSEVISPRKKHGQHNLTQMWKRT